MRKLKMLAVALTVCFVTLLTAYGQSTEFTYQGQMQSGSAAANGNFDLEFALFDAASGGSQVGSTVTRSGVAVTNGVFSVNLDFGANFSGAGRFLEIRVRAAGGGAFTTLSPRQPVNSAPYSIRSLNAANADNANTATTAANLSNPLGGDVIGSQSNTTVARLQGRNVANTPPSNGQVLKFNTTNSRWEPANDETATGGSGGTITGVTAGTGLTGGGTTGTVTVGIATNGVGTTQLADASVTDAKIVGVAGSKVSGAIPVASVPAGSGNYIQNGTTTQAASNFNISGTGSAGIFNASTQFNLNGDRILSSPGSANLFAGLNSGRDHTSGTANSFFGAFSGRANTTGGGNSFLGQSSGTNNTTGFGNTFVGLFAGAANITGDSNTAIGRDANVGISGLTNATAIGANARVSTSNSLVLGSIEGVNGATSNTNVGIGTSSPTHLLTVGAPETTLFGTKVGIFDSSSFNVVLRETSNDVETFWGVNVNNGALFGTTSNHMLDFRTSGLQRMAIAPTGEVALTTLGVAGATSLCRNASNQIASCSGGSLPAGSSNYIQNGTTPQASTNFNISGTGTAGILTANTQFNIGNNRVLSNDGQFNLIAGALAGLANTGSSNSFFGFGAGNKNTTGSANSFFGRTAGDVNTIGEQNSFFGADAGRNNLSGSNNSFFGRGSGFANTTGNSNSFFGSSSGLSNTTATGNSFFGAEAGRNTTTGGNNAFFGTGAGELNTSGFNNAFFGVSAGSNNTFGISNAFFGNNAGQTNTTGVDNAFFGGSAGNGNTTGNNNTIIGDNADVSSGNLTNATAIGADALVAANNSLVLGSINGINGATADSNVGIGTTAPTNLLTVGPPEATVVNGRIGVFAPAGFNVVIRETTNDVESFWGVNSSSGAFIGTSTSDTLGFRTNGTARMTIAPTGEVAITTLGAAGATTLCRNALNQISSCSSSLRYKTNIAGFAPGLNFVNKLRPISYDWKDGGMHDIGFGAEDVARIDPRFVTYNEKGEVEGVKYDRIGVVLVNAVKEQQRQIEQQTETIKRQQQELDLMKAFLCAKPDRPAFCGK